MKMKKMPQMASIGFIVFTLIFSFLVVGLAHAADWMWQNPLPQANLLTGVWGSSGNDVFAVGWNGMILHHGSSTAIVDFNGDGNTDILWRNTSSGQNAVWYMDGVTLMGIADLPGLPNTDYAFVGP